MDTTQCRHEIYVQTFGKFSISGMGEELNQEEVRSDMLIKLLAYILSHRTKVITVQELVEALWQDERSDNPTGALKNLVYRLRTLLKSKWPDLEFIDTGRGSYKWNENIEVSMDASIFEESFKKALKETDSLKRIEYLEEAVSLYKGTLLPKLIEEYWVVAMSTYYHSMYISAVKELAKELDQVGRYDEMEAVCAEALKAESLEETVHFFFIKSLIRQKKYQLAKEQYQKTVTVLYDNLGVTPSEELRDLYKEILKETHEEEADIQSIIGGIEEKEKGAFLCDYGVFKEIYCFERKRSARMGIAVYLLLVTLSPKANIKKDSAAYKRIVKEGAGALKDVLIRALRGGDVISQYSASQLMIMLPSLQQETANLVIERIMSEYDKTPAGRKVNLQFGLSEMLCTPEGSAV
ncbi:DNA-binding SARP family transcriptional activator [Lachnospiraceae bacterium PFB1-21]|uniref:AfsR/SARP family transcriptional regulator n=1 Tax=Ohessyouella blattaphilus TaxID=2949333 RepID=UPI003E1F1389